MYSPLYIPMIRAEQEEIAARAMHRHQVRELRAADTTRSGRTLRRAGKAVAAFVAYAAATSIAAISDASGQTNHRSLISTQQLQRGDEGAQ
ncbi:MAG TPA: hypothetical protein VME22_14635 [Solirubrobacteraceae bacterium]|nr:hypothetical protein [Solirubrobacteraceae bacterium]